MSDEVKKLADIMADDERRHFYFIANKDTYKGINWFDFIQIADNCGFITGYYSVFTGEDNIDEREILYYYPNNGLILYAFTKGGNKIEYARLYGEIDAAQNFNLNDFFMSKHFEECSCTSYENTKTVGFSFSVNEGLCYKLDAVLMNFKPNEKWHSGSLPLLCNYMETKGDEIEVLYPLIVRKKIIRNKGLFDIFSLYIG